MKAAPLSVRGMARHALYKNALYTTRQQRREASALRRLSRWHGPVSIRRIGAVLEDMA